ncbi:MmgE/PrpD family protein [Aeromicrobium sp.]|uniref:MmgE/PrpD family protein n=1 Tax=Aeromicrobium sp. TaxID=1871063 RepID=UPI00198EC77F|nr:MmgE/PrpD family protein [Aeromicrobium sp.]MBC7630902.1 MmgE/PrpD family protein [Aeromicrobium sp.]
MAGQLAAFATDMSADQLPDDVGHAARRHLLDGIGNAIAARRTGAGRPSWDVAHSLGGPGEAVAVGGRVRLSAPAAALASGSLVHALDFDDTHGGAIVHATAVVLPAAFAVGQECRADGAAVVAATAVGLEVACRLGLAAPHGFHRNGLHATAVVGPIAAAVVAGRLRGIGPGRLADAIGIAASSSGGLLEFLDDGADTKILHPGTASMNGIVAARLAEAGAAGPAGAIEGRRGLYAALSAVEPDLTVLTAGLGSRWEAMSIGIKRYPSCQLMHVTLDAVSAALETCCVSPETIDEVEVFVHPDSIDFVGDVREGGLPLNSYDAKFDLRWSVAALLNDGAVTVDTYAPASIARPEVARLARRVTVTPWPGDCPAIDALGRVVIRRHGGMSTDHRVPASRGSAALPLSDQQLGDKFVQNCAHHTRAQELMALVMDLSTAHHIDAVLQIAADISDERN